MEFRGIVSLDQYTAHQLSLYLIEKESELSLKIIDSLAPSIENIPEPKPPINKLSSIPLSEAVLLFGKKVRAIVSNRQFKPSEEIWKKTAEEINKQCWNYLEILENSVSELFLQVKSAKGYEWKEDLLEVVHSIKMTLMHHMEDLEWALKRLDAQIWQLRLGLCKSHFIAKLKYLSSFFISSLDQKLMSNLVKTEKFLSFNEGKFHDEYVGYQQLHQDVRKYLLKFEDYQVLEHLHSDSKEVFKKVYEFLKMWEINQKVKLVSKDELIQALKNFNDPKRIFHIFEEYLSALYKELFGVSRILKSDADQILGNDFVRSELMRTLTDDLKEVHLLGATVSKYREFLLRSDPNPYVRCRLGFPEWVVGAENELTKNMLLLDYEVEELNQFFEEIIHKVNAVTKDHEIINLTAVNEACEKYIHEMSQPLISESTMKVLAEKILHELDQVNELTSFQEQVVDLVGKNLSKILKADWKYQVLFDMSHFEKIYSTHIGIVRERHEERSHLNRLNEFKRLCKEVKDLVKTKSFYKKEQEVELILNDIKSSLQDFLAFVQRAVHDGHIHPYTVKDIYFQLLEYRYLFGQYFYELKTIDSDKQSIRNKFIFVDQYLDTVDQLLEGIKK